MFDLERTGLLNDASISTGVSQNRPFFSFPPEVRTLFKDTLQHMDDVDAFGIKKNRARPPYLQE